MCKLCVIISYISDTVNEQTPIVSCDNQTEKTVKLNEYNLQVNILHPRMIYFHLNGYF